MPIYERGVAEDHVLIDECERGFGWIAHPEETGARASHALVGDEGGVWLLDPLHADGIQEKISKLGEVEGVVVFSNYHVRDAEYFAEQYSVPIYCPKFLHRTRDRVETQTRSVGESVRESGFRIFQYKPFPGWVEAIAFRDSDRTLYVPDAMGTTDLFTVRNERIGVYLLARLNPPRDILAGQSPDRILVGHGSGILDNAEAELNVVLGKARRRLPSAIRSNGVAQLKALWRALG